MKITFCLLVSASLLLGGCAVAPTHPALQQAVLPDLIPVRDFVADRQSNGGYQISPDGKKLAWFGVSGIRPAIFVKVLGGQEYKSFNIHPRYFRWSADSRHLLFVADRGGDEDTHIFAGNADGPDTDLRNLTPFAKTRANIVRVIKSGPAGSSEIVITDNRRDKKVFDLHRIDLVTGRQTTLTVNPGKVAFWGVDRRGNLIARVVQTGERIQLQLKPASDGQDWITTAEWTIFDAVHPLETSDDAKWIWAISNRGRDKKALVKLELASGKETVIHAESDVDIDKVRISERTLLPLTVYSDPDYPKTEILDPRLRAALTGLLDGKPAELSIHSIDDQERMLTLAVGTDRGIKNYLVDVDTGQASLLGEDSLARLDNSNTPLASIKPISFQSRDGVTLHGYFTLPAGAKAEKLPLVLGVHGGPWARDSWTSAAKYTQFLANRGYAVLRVNYRGSSGYGRAFMEKAMGEFAGKMHDDLIDGVNWAIKTGAVDPARIAISGGSYGGYATMVGLTFTPEVFACGVNLVGVTDLARLLETAPAYWELGKPWWYRYVGDPGNPEDRKKMNAKSPLYKAAAVTKPVLIMHGVNDPRVKLEQADLMVEALRQAGKSVDYVKFQDDGHGNRKWTNNLEQYRKTEDFLAGCLGGRSSGFDFYELAAWAF